MKNPKIEYKECASKNRKFTGCWQKWTKSNGKTETHFEWIDTKRKKQYHLKGIDHSIAEAIMEYTKMEFIDEK